MFYIKIRYFFLFMKNNHLALSSQRQYLFSSDFFLQLEVEIYIHDMRGRKKRHRNPRVTEIELKDYCVCCCCCYFSEMLEKGRTFNWFQLNELKFQKKGLKNKHKKWITTKFHQLNSIEIYWQVTNPFFYSLSLTHSLTHSLSMFLCN